MHFFFLVNGVTWAIASKLVKNTLQYEKTLNRIFNKIKDKNTFSDQKEKLTFEYINKKK